MKNADGFVQHFSPPWLPPQLTLQAFENAQVGIDGARRVYDALEEGNHPGKEVFEDNLVNKHTEERLFVVGGGEGCLRLWLWAPGYILDGDGRNREGGLQVAGAG